MSYSQTSQKLRLANSQAHKDRHLEDQMGEALKFESSVGVAVAAAAETENTGTATLKQ